MSSKRPKTLEEAVRKEEVVTAPDEVLAAMERAGMRKYRAICRELKLTPQERNAMKAGIDELLREWDGLFA